MCDLRVSNILNILLIMNFLARKNWDLLAEEDAMFAVLSIKKKKGKWEAEEFFETGRKEVAEDLERIENLGIKLNFRKALDFGCGIGRLTKVLARSFETVYGIDVSEKMLEKARYYAHEQKNCVYLPVSHLNQFPSDTFDFIYSKIALQHIKPRDSMRFLKSLCRVTKRGGCLFFQQRAKGKDAPYSLRLAIKGFLPESWREKLHDARLHYSRKGIIDVYGVPLKEIVSLLEEQNFEIKDAYPHKIINNIKESYYYCAVKK